jgi:hypothetical protein
VRINLKNHETKPHSVNRLATRRPIGGNGQDGGIFLYPKTATNLGDLGQANIVLSAEKGDVTFANADCAEEFDIADAEEISPGMVMVLDEDGKLQQSRTAYDKKVAGVVYGAGDCKPGNNYG